MTSAESLILRFEAVNQEDFMCSNILAPSTYWVINCYLHVHVVYLSLIQGY